jgi:uncharacterized protein (DUF1501 family)
MGRIIVNIFRRGAVGDQLEICPSESVPSVSHFDDYRTANRFPTAHVALSDATRLGNSGYAVNNAFTAFRDRWNKPSGMRSAAWLTIGSEFPSRSHTFAQNRMDGGGDSYAVINSGWMNRVAQLEPRDYALDLLSMGNGAARSIIGTDYRYAATINTIPAVVKANSDRARLMMTGTPSTPEAAAARANAQAVGDTVEALSSLTIPPASSLIGNYPKGWGDGMKDIARLIIAGIPARYITCDYPGWDHHKDMGGSAHSPSGLRQHAEMLAIFNASVVALMADLEATGNADRVLITTQSEFHRTMRQNGAEGADHGCATHGYAWGTSVVSGLYGAPLDYREYSPAYLDSGSWQDRNNNRLLGYTFDYRDWQRMQAEWLLERPMTPEEISQVWGVESNPPAEQWKISHV